VRTVKLDLAVVEHVESVEQGVMRAGLWDDLPEAGPFDVYPPGESLQKSCAASSSESSAATCLT